MALRGIGFNMTRAFEALKNYPRLNAKIGDQIIMGEADAKEEGIDALVDKGFFKEQTEEEALTFYIGSKEL